MSQKIPEAWNRFYDIYSPVMMTICKAKGCPDEMAEDAIQITMMKLFRKMESGFQYDPKSNFRGLLAKMVRGFAIDEIRKADHYRFFKNDGSQFDAENSFVGDHDDAAFDYENQIVDRHLCQIALDNARRKVAEPTFMSYKMYVLEKAPIDDVIDYQRKHYNRCNHANRKNNQDLIYGDKRRVNELLNSAFESIQSETGEVVRDIESRLDKICEPTTTQVLHHPPENLKIRLDRVRTILLHNPPPTAADAHLLVKRKTDSFWIPLHESKTIGSGEDNDARLSSTSVSRRHFSVHREENTWRLQDLNSTNGVQVNGRRATKHYLLDGDILRIGDFSLIFLRNI